MGYTHYWRTTAFNAAQWEKLCNATKNVIMEAVRDGIYVDRECDDQDQPPLIRPTLIAFNGRGDSGYETFYFQKDNATFQFCKTACKPYDDVVVAVLILAHHFCPDFTWESDGDATDFEAGKDLAEFALGNQHIEDLGVQ